MSNIKGNIYCPLCRKVISGFNIWVKTDVGDILRCNNCSLGFLNPNLKDTSDLEKIRLSAYNLRTYYKLLIRKQNELSLRYKKQLKEISRIVKEKGKLIDIGCSIGMFLSTAASFGFEPYGYDKNDINLRKAEKFFAINILSDNFLEIKKYKNLFDVATMWDVLEHLKDPVEYLSKLISIVKPGGLLVVQCPNMESYEFLKFGNKWNWLTPGDHLQFFTPITLIKVVAAAGFIPIKVKIWLDPLTFSNTMLSVRNRDPSLLFNRFLTKILTKFNSFFKKLEINIPFEKIRVLYGWLLQLLHHGGHRHSLIKLFAIKPNKN
ncbi:MAG: class I SAM-dependent methyltransferase [Promethearchaeota archaeon]